MNVSNAEVAKAFLDIAVLLELENANPFRIRAYRNAARLIDSLPEPVSELLSHDVDLSTFPGIGSDLAQKIGGFVETGHIPLLDELSRHYPKSILELSHVESLGAKRIALLHDQLGISSLKDLKKAAEKGEIQKLEGFGEKTEKKILEGIKSLGLMKTEGQVLRSSVDQIAEELLSYLKQSKDVIRAEIAGSFRRRKETIGDLDILVIADNSRELIDHFVAYENVLTILSKGKTRSSVVLRDGLHVDLRVLKKESFGSGLYYFTGSKAHNIEVRKIARSKGMKLNEYGVFKGKQRLAGALEEDIFNVMGLDYIPPELRENRGEIEAARKHLLPKLIELSDLQGDLHAHTVATDGQNTILEMAQMAKRLGLKYLAITDHSKHLRVARGLDVQRLKKHIEEIDKANEMISGIKILKGIEVDILENGSLDLPDSILSELDIRVCSVHYQLKMNQKDMTDRILKAMDNPYFNILGHPTGRLIFKRAPSTIDFEKIVKASLERGVFFEINCQPERLDLDAEHCQMLKELGARFSISSDAHSIIDLQFLHFGVDQARRGWVEKKNVINTLMWNDLRKLLRPH